MKVRLLIILLAGVIVAGCTSLQDPSKRGKNITIPTDFSHPDANTAYYEFTSYNLETPSVLEETANQPAEDVTAEPGEDEDFTAEDASSAYGTYGDVVVTVASHKFKLGANASRKEMTAFQTALDNAYTVALRQYRPVGFTYAMSSVGAVNPLSDVDVACKLSERSANQVGQVTCGLFFTTISQQYLKLMKGGK